MDYFYIATGIASLLAFLGFLTTGFWPDSLSKQVVIYGAVFAVATVLFWLWFYFAPINVARERIWERTIAVKFFENSATGVGVAEGEFSIDSFSSKTIMLPPFQNPPEVTLYRDKAGELLRLTGVTTDAFTVESFSSEQWGEWSFRARGQLLKRRSLNP